MHDLIFSKVLTVDTLSETRLLSGLQQDVQADVLSKSLTVLKESIESRSLKPYQPQVAPHGAPLSVQYLAASDKLLLKSGASLRLLSRDSQTHDFPMSHLSFTGVTPSSPTADVRLNLNLKTLHYLLTTLDWSLVNEETFTVLGRFLEICMTNNTQDSVIVPYSLGLIVVKALLNAAITQFELLEQAFESL